MGLFSRKPKEPVVHPTVERTIWLRADPIRLGPHLDEYAAIMGKRARAIGVEAWRSGEWLRLSLPREGVHPWEHHNLAYWLLELGDVVVAAGETADFPAYSAERGPSPLDLFEGHTAAGEPVSFHVPTNKVVRSDSDVAVAKLGTAERLASAGVPVDGWAPVGAVDVRSEDPQHDLGPRLDDVVANRAALRRFQVDVTF